MSEVTTIVVDTKDDSDNDDDTNYDTDHENIEEPMLRILQIQYLHSVCLKTRFGNFMQSATLMITLHVTFVERKMNHKLVNITLLDCIVILFFFFSFLN